MVLVSIFGDGNNCDDKDWFWAYDDSELVVYANKSAKNISDMVILFINNYEANYLYELLFTVPCLVAISFQKYWTGGRQYMISMSSEFSLNN